MNLVIVINTFRRSLELVERSLNAALNINSTAKLNIKRVILIDQNRPSLELPESITQNSRFERQLTSSQSVSAARNGVQIPEGVDWILFCDDDGYLKSDYLQELDRLMGAYSDLDLFAGSIVRDDTGEYYSPWHRLGGSLARFKNAKLLMGSNFVVRTKVFDQLGRFDSAFGAGAYWGSGEETDFAWKAYFSGVKMEFFKELVVFHVKPYAGDFQHSVKKAFRYGRGKGALVYKWLIRNGRGVVVRELVEMLCIPLAQMLVSLVTFRWSRIPVFISVLWGRVYGCFAAMAWKGWDER